MAPGPPIRDGTRGGGPAARWADAAGVFLLALVVRALFLPGVVDLPVAGDERYYWAYRNFLADGNVDRLVLRPPLWSYVVAGMRVLHDDPFAVRALMTLIGACAPPLVYLLGARVFDRRTGLVAGIALAFYPEHLAYSHYIWAEGALATLVVLIAHLFFRYFESGRTGQLVVASLVAGLSVLVKVFAVVVFGAAMVTLLASLTGRVQDKLAKCALASLLFLLPTAVYSVAASQMAGRRVVLSETGVLSMRQAIGLDPGGGLTYRPGRRDERAAELVATLRERPLDQAFLDTKRQVENLWTPNSFVVHRLLATGREPGPDVFLRGGELHPEEWQYGLPPGWSLGLAAVVSGCTILVLVLGVAGLCLSEPTPFKLFSAVCLLGLCASAAVAFMTSRYRLSFAFVFVIHAAHLALRPRAAFAHLTNPRRSVPLVAALALYAHVVLIKAPTIGDWG